MATQTAPDRTDSATSELLAVFRGELSEVQFPGVDASTLDAAVTDVSRQLDAVASLEAALSDARDSLRAKQQVLREHARHALAYARVYATGNEALTAKLDGISFERPAKTTPRKRRQRKPKPAASTAPQLALDSAAKQDKAA